ncbi:MAG TPA: prolyl aminopeptidase, partial [Thermomicrobiales bacterium]|nr:prolyl aminopeptidase [Thermomicrobiales bacterium]
MRADRTVVLHRADGRKLQCLQQLPSQHVPARPRLHPAWFLPGDLYRRLTGRQSSGVACMLRPQAGIRPSGEPVARSAALEWSMPLFPPIEPFATGMLPIAGGNDMYWEASGNPDGKPALHLHGGPGSGIQNGYRRRFDPERFLIVSFEQRSCGRSRPLASDPAADLSTNTTPALVGDIEALREFLGVERWLVSGISWGTTLALAYAQAHPDRVSELVLTAVTTTTASEVEWITEAMGRVFPREWEAFAAAARRKPGQRLIDAYYDRITDPDPAVRAEAACAWCAWEDVHVSLDPAYIPSPRYDDPQFRAVFATLVIHYWKHAAFIPGDGLLAGMDRLAGIAGVLIHGRLDVSSPLAKAWSLHRAWPGSELIV